MMKLCSRCGHTIDDNHFVRDGKGFAHWPGCPGAIQQGAFDPFDATGRLRRHYFQTDPIRPNSCALCGLPGGSVIHSEEPMTHGDWEAMLALSHEATLAPAPAEGQSPILICTRCNKPITDGHYIGDGDGTGNRFAHPSCYRHGVLLQQVLAENRQLLENLTTVQEKCTAQLLELRELHERSRQLVDGK